MQKLTELNQLSRTTTENTEKKERNSIDDDEQGWRVDYLDQYDRDLCEAGEGYDLKSKKI